MQKKKIIVLAFIFVLAMTCLTACQPEKSRGEKIADGASEFIDGVLGE